MTVELVTIGNFALLTGLSIPMLRYYHELGLLEPAEVDPSTGYRRYSLDQIATGRMIARLRSIELPVADLTRALSGERSVLGRVLRDHRERLVARMEDTHQMLAHLDELVKEDTTMTPPGSLLVEVTLQVRDLDATVSFYRDVFGFEFHADDHNGAAPTHYDACGGEWTPEATFLFTLWPAGDGPETTGMHIGFGVPNVDDVWSRASSIGATLLSPPTDDPYVPRNAKFEDPAGNHITVYERVGW